MASAPDPATTEPTSNPFSLKQYTPGVRKITNFGSALFFLALVVAVFWAPSYWVVSVLCSCACMALGFAVGFLFGVPRASTAKSASRVNTNLEQISDWLTKILVGVGLTQLQKIPWALRELARFISRDYGTSGNDVFSLSMVLYFWTLGFLMGYLLTRLALQKEFDDAESVQVDTRGPAEVRITQPHLDEAGADKAAAEDSAADETAAEEHHGQVGAR